jgi:hypothetical protein
LLTLPMLFENQVDLWNVSLRSTFPNHSFLLAADYLACFQVIGCVRYAAYKFTVIVSILSALINKIRNIATILEKHVINSRVPTNNYNSFAQIRVKTFILIIWNTIAISI